MSLPDWVESVGKLIGGLIAKPLAASRPARMRAAYTLIRFGETLADLVKSGIARPLRELGDSQLAKIKSLDISEAAAAHNKMVTDRLLAEAEVEKAKAEASKARAEAQKIRAEARAIDTQSDVERGRFELERLKEQRELAEANIRAKREAFEIAVKRLKLQGGDLYLPDSDDDTASVT